MYNSKYYTCEQIDERLLQGYLDDYNEVTGKSLTKNEFIQLLQSKLDNGLTYNDISQEFGEDQRKVISQAKATDQFKKIAYLMDGDEGDVPYV